MMKNMRGAWAAICCLSVGAIAVGVAMTPQRAEACGGTFCDGGPVPMPVDQSGENILFVWEGDSIEAHIQIQYMGEPSQFAWVIPLQSNPEFSVGSEPLFQALLAASVPQVLVNQTFDQCEDPSASASASGDDGAGSGANGDGEDSGADDDPSGGGVEVLQEVQVGAFQIDVIQGTDAQAVVDWLDANGYAQDDEAPPILQEYIDGGFIFGAVKLVGGAGVDQIHPIVLRFQGSEPCVPLKLTRIAAVENMAVRSFFLGDNRMAPQNYRHVVINQAKLNWSGSPAAANYVDVITLAVDEENADGRAFVTEYAGPSDVVNSFNVFNPAWDPTAFQTLDPTLLRETLEQQNLIDCYGDFTGMIGWLHPLIEPLVAQFITVDGGELIDGICGGTYDSTAWDGVAFATQMTLRIVEPGAHAADLLGQNDYLTRLYTTISPGEMTTDPMFWESPDLPDVSNQLTANQRFLCNGDNVWTLPDGREVYLPVGAQWPDFPDEPEGTPGQMPSSEIIEAVMPAGAPMRLTENTDRIDAVIMAHNEQYGWPGGAMPDPTGSASGDDTGEGGQDGDGGGDSGCACASDRPKASGWGAMLVLMSLGVLRRRRRA